MLELAPEFERYRLLRCFFFFSSRMREYKRESERATQNQIYDLAAVEVLENNCNIGKASQNFFFCQLSFYRYIKKKKNNDSH